MCRSNCSLSTPPPPPPHRSPGSEVSDVVMFRGRTAKLMVINRAGQWIVGLFRPKNVLKFQIFTKFKSDNKGGTGPKNVMSPGVGWGDG